MIVNWLGGIRGGKVYMCVGCCDDTLCIFLV